MQKELDGQKTKANGSQKKNDVLKKLKSQGEEPIEYIIAYGLTEHESFTDENALISLFKISDEHGYQFGQFTNAVLGHGTKEQQEAQKKFLKRSGTVTQIEQSLYPETVDVADLNLAETLVISINPSTHKQKDYQNYLGEKHAIIHDDDWLDHFNSKEIQLRSLGKWSVGKDGAKKQYKYLVAVSHVGHSIAGAFELKKRPKEIEYITAKGQHRVRISCLNPDTAYKEVQQKAYESYEPTETIKDKNGNEIALTATNHDGTRNIKKLVWMKDGRDGINFTQSGIMSEKWTDPTKKKS